MQGQKRIFTSLICVIFTKIDTWQPFYNKHFIIGYFYSSISFKLCNISMAFLTDETLFGSGARKLPSNFCGITCSRHSSWSNCLFLPWLWRQLSVFHWQTKTFHFQSPFLIFSTIISSLFSYLITPKELVVYLNCVTPSLLNQPDNLKTRSSKSLKNRPPRLCLHPSKSEVTHISRPTLSITIQLQI